MEEQTKKLIEEELKKFLSLLEVEVSADILVDENEVVQVSLQSESAGLLIGYYGQTLASLQLIFNLIIYKKLGAWAKIIFNVGDWRQKREEYLKNMALNLAQRVEESGEAIACPHLTASERRVVHLVLQDHPRVMTESEGEGQDRRLVVKMKA